MGRGALTWNHIYPEGVSIVLVMIIKELILKTAHINQKCTDENVTNYLSDYFLRTRENHTPNMFKLTQSEGDKREGGGAMTEIDQWKQCHWKIIQEYLLPIFSATKDRYKYSSDWLIYYLDNSNNKY